MTTDNLASFLPFLDGCIVGSAFKQGLIDTETRRGPNIAKPARRYAGEKIAVFLTEAKKPTK